MMRIVEEEKFRDVHIQEGDTFLLPANTPHNPVRFADTVRMVMERKRPEGSLDRLRWYCSKGNHARPTIIHEFTFHCVDLGTQLKPLIEEWQNNEALRLCKACGQVEDSKLIQC